MKILYPNIPWTVRWDAIKETLHQEGLSFEKIGRDFDVSSPAMAKTKHYPAAQQAIASALQIAPEVLFPERYKTVWSEDHQNQIDLLMGPLLGLSVGEAKHQLMELIEGWSAVPADIAAMPTDAKAKWGWIMEQLKARGMAIKQLANELSLRRSAIYNLANHAYDQPQTLVARCLGHLPQTIWPDRYKSDGAPLKLRSGKPAFATQRVIDPRHMLDLATGLWLPLTTVEGLPGIGSRKQYVDAQAKRENWVLREREGLIEVTFKSLPTLTKLHLTRGWSPQDIVHATAECADLPANRRIELSRNPSLNQRYVLSVSTEPGALITLTLCCLNCSSGEVINEMTTTITGTGAQALVAFLTAANQPPAT